MLCGQEEVLWVLSYGDMPFYIGLLKTGFVTQAFSNSFQAAEYLFPTCFVLCYIQQPA